MWTTLKRATMKDALVHLLCASSILHHINTFWGMSLGNCLEWKIKHFSYCCRLYYTNIRMMLDIYSYTMWYMRQYLGIVQIFLFFCILQSNSTLTSSYLCTPSILLYQVHRECARTLTIVAALLYNIKVVAEYLITLTYILLIMVIISRIKTNRARNKYNMTIFILTPFFSSSRRGSETKIS